MKITYTDAVSAIITGELDADLSRLTQAIQNRKRLISATNVAVLKSTLKVGDKVRLTMTANPSYIRGVEAVIRKFKTKKVVIDLVRPAGRFHKNIVCPLDILEAV
jgi:hypothetical protein